MELCDTEIVTFTAGQRSRFCARGTLLREGDVCRVCYVQDGDRVTLTVREQSLSMEREGVLRADFVRGARTSMALLAGERRGEIPVETEQVGIRMADGGLHMMLRYRLCFAEAEQVFTLKIAVRIISEEG